MIDHIIEALFSILDITGTLVGEKNKSPFFKVLGCLVWLLILSGIVGLLIYWLK